MTLSITFFPKIYIKNAIVIQRSYQEEVHMSYLNSFLVATAAVAALVGVGTANAIPAVFPTQLSENNTVQTV